MSFELCVLITMHLNVEYGSCELMDLAHPLRTGSYRNNLPIRIRGA